MNMNMIMNLNMIMIMNLIMFTSMAMMTAGTVQAQTLTLRGADSLWARNYAKNDTINAMKLMAKDFAMTSSNGNVKNRERELGDIRPVVGGAIEYFRTKDVTVEELGTSGMVSGTAEWRFVQNGRAFNTVRAYNAIYRKGGDFGWELVALYIRNAPGSSSFTPLKWIEGSWIGSGSNSRFFERYTIKNDTTLVVESLDSAFSRTSDSTFFESRRGMITNRGNAKYVAQMISADSIVFIPLLGVRNGFVWKRSPNNSNQWFAVIRPLSGNERTYTMTRR